jgi:hypothetical protein
MTEPPEVGSTYDALARPVQRFPTLRRPQNLTDLADAVHTPNI